MAISAGARLKSLRVLLGLPRERFCELVGIENMRLTTIENERGRMSTDDLLQVVTVFPEVLSWLVLGAPVDVEMLEKSENLHLKKLALSLRLAGKMALTEAEAD